ncbi:ABC transporter permease [Guptibacillus hwajinpoensis]
MEFFKLYRSNQYIIYLILISGLIILSSFLSFFEPGDNTNFVRYFYYIFMVNGQYLFPIVVTLLYAGVITKEYREDTIKILYRCSYSKESIIWGKYLSSSLFLLASFLLIIILYLIIVNFGFANINTISEAYYTKSILHSLFDLILIAFSYLSYILAYGSFVYFISILTKKIGLSILISFGTNIGIHFLGLPKWLIDHLFLYSYNVYGVLSLLDVPYFEIIRINLVNVLTILIFLTFGTIVFKKQRTG